MTQDSATRFLTLLCAMVPGVRAASYVNSSGSDGALAHLAHYPDNAAASDRLESLLRDTLISKGSISDTVCQANDGPAIWLLTQPIRCADSVGAVGLEFTGIDQEQQPAIEQLVAWAAQWATLIEPATSCSADNLSATLTTALLDAQTLDHALARACSLLAKHLGCQRVTIGLVHNHSVTLKAVSDRASFDAHSQAATHFSVAMNEAWDQSSAVMWPACPSQSDTVDIGHQQLARSQQASVCSLNLGRLTPAGVVTLVRSQEAPFGATDLDILNPLAELIGEVVLLRRSAEQSAAARIVTTLRRWRDDWVFSSSARRRLTVAGSVAALAFALFGSATHQVSAPAALAGVSERTLASPVDGYLSEVYVRPGARVARGDVLASLDSKPLERQRRQLQGQRNQLNGEYNVALGNLDGATARILQSQLAQTDVQIEHLDDQLSRLEITAPFDGLVLDGDLMHATGAPVSLGDTLFRMTPDEGYLVRLHVDEADVAALGLGAQGRLKLAALPDAELRLEVIRINGVAQTLEGRSVLEMEATVSGDQRYLRPGMKGVARLDAGRAGLLWIWTHSVLRRMKLWFWQFSPVV